MTVATYTYTATVAGNALSVRDGDLTFDAGRSPYVEGSLEIARPSSTVLALLDSRMSPPPRVVVTATRTTGGVETTRTFDMHVRDRVTQLGGATVTIPLASDEALLEDWAPLADDLTPRSYEASLRNLVNYVLDKIIPGAALQPGATNADLTASFGLRNLITNPRQDAGGASFLTAGNCSTGADANFPGPIDGVSHSGIHLYSPTSADSYVNVGPTTGMAFGTSPGKTYVLSGDGSVRSTLTGAAVTSDYDQNAQAVLPRERALVVFVSGPWGADKIFHSPQVPATVMTGANGTRVAVEFTVPQGATMVRLRAYHGRAGGTISWGKFQLAEKTAGMTTADAAEYIFGNKPVSARYAYSWDNGGAANASPSVRTALVERRPEVFTWKAGQNGLEFLFPLVQVAGFRLVCDEARRWTLRNETYEAPGSLSLRHGTNIVEASETMSRDAGLWFDARVTRYRWTDQDGAQQERIDAYALNTPYTRLTTLDLAMPYPGPGRSEYAVRRAQGIGREVSVTTVADFTALAEQPVQVILPDAPILRGSIRSVTFNLGDDEMTVTTRTVDTPAGAVDLLLGTVNALTGTVNAL